MSGLISVAEADRLIAEFGDQSPVISSPLGKAAGRVLRENIYADRPLPPFNRVMMDGYALRYADIEHGCGEFKVCGQLMAGDCKCALPEETAAAIEIMTGAPLPEGADVVVPYEETIRESEAFTLAKDANVEPGQYIHREGSDFAAQSLLVPAGASLGPVEMGVAASCGYTELKVSSRPRIAVIGTGDELVPVSTTPLPHQIRSSNAVTVESALGLADYHVGEIDHWCDDAELGKARMIELLGRTDVMIIAGAVSKGQRDWIPGALDEVAQCIFHGVRQRPGKPMGLWRTGEGKMIFALPGNPVSAMVGLHRYVLPYLCARDGFASSTQSVCLAEDIASKSPMTWFLPVEILDDGTAAPRPVNNSGDYARLCGTDGFIELSAEASQWKAGISVPFYNWSK
ncbi:molybdopterin molybdotransferase MoeA [Cerasicoccus maritimus]|uniref:molybdopterin molybdotransferase MoeA n=1 Tax=Cerasicoccus maritimus TaxID=490089 RepID=UPI002852B246|nr:molybdopterin molybdotransferase MoeA [Cerasicoccus maritimus]